MFTIGLTGGIGSGKTTIAGMFSDLGVPVYDTDSIARRLVEPGQPALDEIIESFGKQVLQPDGTLDRAKLKKLVFDDEQARMKLEAILHPRIKEELLLKINSGKTAYCIAVIPLLLEKNWQTLVDRILVVDVSEQTQLTRAGQRDQLPESMVRKIMDSQLDRQRRLTLADDIIDNNGGPETVKVKVNALHKKYLKMATTAE